MNPELAQRLDRLERQNRRLRVGVGLALILALLAIGVAITPAARALSNVEAATLDANRLIIRDRANRPRLIIGVEAQGAGFTFLEPNGRTHAFLNVTSGELGRTVVEESGAHTPGVYLYDRKGMLSWHAP